MNRSYKTELMDNFTTKFFKNMWFNIITLLHLITHFKEVFIILLLQSYGCGFLIVAQQPHYFLKKGQAEKPPDTKYPEEINCVDFWP